MTGNTTEGHAHYYSLPNGECLNYPLLPPCVAIYMDKEDNWDSGHVWTTEQFAALNFCQNSIWFFCHKELRPLWLNKSAQKRFKRQQHQLSDVTFESIVSQLSSAEQEIFTQLRNMLLQLAIILEEQSDRCFYIIGPDNHLTPWWALKSDAPGKEICLKIRMVRLSLENSEVQNACMLQAVQELSIDQMRAVAMHHKNPLFTFMFDKKGKLLSLNNSAKQKFCKNSTTLWDILKAGIYPGGESEAQKILNEAITTVIDKQEIYRYYLQRHNQKNASEIRWLLLEMRPLDDPVSEQPTMLVAMYNVTKLMQMQENLKRDQEAMKSMVQKERQEEERLQKSKTSLEEINWKLEQERRMLQNQIQEITSGTVVKQGGIIIDTETPAEKTLDLLQKLMQDDCNLQLENIQQVSVGTQVENQHFVPLTKQSVEGFELYDMMGYKNIEGFESPGATWVIFEQTKVLYQVKDNEDEDYSVKKIMHPFLDLDDDISKELNYHKMVDTSARAPPELTSTFQEFARASGVSIPEGNEHTTGSEKSQFSIYPLLEEPEEEEVVELLQHPLQEEPEEEDPLQDEPEEEEVVESLQQISLPLQNSSSKKRKLQEKLGVKVQHDHYSTDYNFHSQLKQPLDQHSEGIAGQFPSSSQQKGDQGKEEIKAREKQEEKIKRSQKPTQEAFKRPKAVASGPNKQVNKGQQGVTKRETPSWATDAQISRYFQLPISQQNPYDIFEAERGPIDISVYHEIFPYLEYRQNKHDRESVEWHGDMYDTDEQERNEQCRGYINNDPKKQKIEQNYNESQ